MPSQGIYKRDELIQQVVKMRLQERLSPSTVLTILMDPNGLGYAKSYAYELMREAKVYISEVYSEYNINSIEEALADLYEQRESAERDKTLKSIDRRKLVRDLTKDINEIKGLYVQRHEVSVTEEPRLFNIEPINVIDITPKKLDEPDDTEENEEEGGIL